MKSTFKRMHDIEIDSSLWQLFSRHSDREKNDEGHSLPIFFCSLMMFVHIKEQVTNLSLLCILFYPDADHNMCQILLSPKRNEEEKIWFSDK